MATSCCSLKFVPSMHLKRDISVLQCTSLSSIAYFPADFAGLENRSVTIVACAKTLVSSYGLLGCMFAPKLYVILFQTE